MYYIWKSKQRFYFLLKYLQRLNYIYISQRKNNQFVYKWLVYKLNYSIMILKLHPIFHD